MTDKPEIKVGQRWVTRGGFVGRILTTDSAHSYPVVVDFENGGLVRYDTQGISAYVDDPVLFELISLAPQTVKREVALWSAGKGHAIYAFDAKGMSPPQHWRQVSEPLTIEFTLLPGESA